MVSLLNLTNLKLDTKKEENKNRSPPVSFNKVFNISLAYSYYQMPLFMLLAYKASGLKVKLRHIVPPKTIPGCIRRTHINASLPYWVSI